jgi:thioredoxin-related protein
MKPVLEAAVLALACTLTLHAREPDADAAGIGAWTTDFPAAVKVAAERQLPIFIQFTGSDWCGWCQKMERECLSKPEFLKAMRTQCVLVSVDFPHKTKLPEGLREQNDELAKQFKKRSGFPAYYIVDNDAKTIRWSFGAHPKYGADLKLLISDMKDFCAGCSGVVERTVTTLPAAQADAYRKAAKAFADRQLVVAAWLGEEHPDGKAAKQEFEHHLKELETLRAAMTKAAVVTPAA